MKFILTSVINWTTSNQNPIEFTSKFEPIRRFMADDIRINSKVNGFGIFTGKNVSYTSLYE